MEEIQYIVRSARSIWYTLQGRIFIDGGQDDITWSPATRDGWSQ